MSLPQNQKLEELFDLPRDLDEESSTGDHDSQTGNDAAQLPVLPETLAALDKIEAALPAVRGLEASDTEMDDLASRATESFDDLMNLGMQVDSRYSSEIFAVASTMLGHAITAKTAKMNKKLKMIDLQMRKLKLDRDAGQDGVGMPTAEGTVLDRNELLRRVLATAPATQNTDAHKYTKES
jgi:hypothetical protein